MDNIEWIYADYNREDLDQTAWLVRTLAVQFWLFSYVAHYMTFVGIVAARSYWPYTVCSTPRSTNQDRNLQSTPEKNAGVTRCHCIMAGRENRRLLGCWGKINLYHSLCYFSRQHFKIFFLFFPENRLWLFMQIVSTYMKCQTIYSGKSKNKSFICHLLILIKVINL